MSDEPKVLAATVMRSLPSGAYHARRALGSLESQNQALQERIAELENELAQRNHRDDLLRSIFGEEPMTPTQETDPG